jgi:hypothetical protein
MTAMTSTLVITDEETKTTWRMPRELLKDLKRYALENDTNVTSVVLRACREFLAKDKMFKDKYNPQIAKYDGISRIK